MHTNHVLVVEVIVFFSKMLARCTRTNEKPEFSMQIVLTYRSSTLVRLAQQTFLSHLAKLMPYSH